jgi:membrane protease subunit HflK
VRRIVLGVALVGYLATGLTVVQQDEVGVVRRFGAVLREPWGPGLHWALPWGLDRVDCVKTGQTRTLTVGARDLQSAPLSRAPDLASDDFLTGDLNLVSAQAIVQYRVSDPGAFLFASSSLQRVLAASAESALTRALAARGIDDVLTVGRAEVAEQVARAVQEQADRQGLGVSVRAVRLGRVAPPVAVAPAFADAARARSDRRQVVTRAEEFRDRALADAKGQAREIADRAAGRFEQEVQTARGEADRFTKVLAAARKDPLATRRRLYLEALTELLPRFRRKVIVAPGQGVDVSLFEGKSNTAAGSADAKGEKAASEPGGMR